jgi:ribosomal protein L24E
VVEEEVRYVWTLAGQATLFGSRSCAEKQSVGETPKRIAWNPAAQSVAAQAAMERACCDNCGLEIGEGEEA